MGIVAVSSAWAQSVLRVSIKDLVTGITLLALAGFFAISAWRDLKLGTPGAMGPGFFPLVVAMALALLAGLIVIRAFRHGTSPADIAGLRPVACILAAPALFGLLVAPAGFVLAIAASGFVAALASPNMRLVEALATALVLTILCAVLFVYLLQMPVPLLGSWFDF